MNRSRCFVDKYFNKHVTALGIFHPYALALGAGTGSMRISTAALLSSIINLFIGPTVTKWAIMAPVFVPMFMMLNQPPEYTQPAYRIGDSATHIISPLMPFFAIVLALAERYDKNIGIGSLVSMMMTYSIAILICWTMFMVVWMSIGLPIGPGVTPYPLGR